MKTIGLVVLTSICMFFGCIAGPTPHPSTTENMAEYGQDSSGGSNEPAPSVGAGDDCESNGGAWDGTECTDGLDPTADAGPASDAKEVDDAQGDTGPLDDGESNLSQDSGVEDESLDTMEGVD